MSQNKDKRITFRVSPEELQIITTKASTAQMTVGMYVRAAALKHKIVRVEGLKEIVHELKAIGRNINKSRHWQTWDKLTQLTSPVSRNK